MWDLPRPRMEPVSPALAGKFFTTEPPGKSRRGSVFRELCLESTLPRVRVFPHLQLGKGTSLGLHGNLALCPLQLRTQESGVWFTAEKHKGHRLPFRVVERRGAPAWPAPGELAGAKGTSVSCWPDCGRLLEGVKDPGNEDLRKTCWECWILGKEP